MERTGCLIRPANTRNYICGAGASDTELPASFILPDDRIPTVRDQGNTNSCVGHAIAETMGILYGMEFGKEKLLSPWYIYGNDECRKGYTGLGMYLGDAVEGVRKCGTVPIEEFDVHKEPPDIIAEVSKRPELKDKAVPYKIEGYMQIPKYAMANKFSNALKQAIYTYQTPVVIASAKYFGGGHRVVLIGWEHRGKFIFLNSWGDGYKDHGKSTIPANYIDEAYVLFDEVLILPFSDVKENEWHYKDVKTAYFSGVINGTSSSAFEPDIPITRAEAAAIVLRVLQKTQDSIDAYALSKAQDGGYSMTGNIMPKDRVTCSDIDESAWYYDEVTRLLATGIMTGDFEGTFRPDDYITRAEVAVIALRLHEYIAKALGVNVKPSESDIKLTDVDADDWFYEAVYAAVKYGLIIGDTEGTFRPLDNITRAEFASIIVRNMKKTDDMFVSLCRV